MYKVLDGKWRGKLVNVDNVFYLLFRKCLDQVGKCLGQKRTKILTSLDLSRFNLGSLLVRFGREGERCIFRTFRSRRGESTRGKCLHMLGERTGGSGRSQMKSRVQ